MNPHFPKNNFLIILPHSHFTPSKLTSAKKPELNFNIFISFFSKFLLIFNSYNYFKVGILSIYFTLQKTLTI